MKINVGITVISELDNAAGVWRPPHSVRLTPFTTLGYHGYM